MESLLSRRDYQRFTGSDKMILPDFILPSRVNQTRSYSGIDSIEHCRDRKHFESYPHDITYHYNSRGFRDAEWPSSIEELQNVIWCVGDSFTVGIGSPREHTWSYQIEKVTNARTINISVDGASNNWICRRSTKILKEISPALLIIQWSYLHRYELTDDTLADDQRQQHFNVDNFHNEQELQTAFSKLIEQVELAKKTTCVVHSFIPDCGAQVDLEKIWKDICGPAWPDCPTNIIEFQNLDKLVVNELKTVFQKYDYIKDYFEWCKRYNKLLDKINYIPEIVRLDLARDGHHYDLLTAQQFAREISKLLNARLS
jgi:hypothetical protein